MQFFRDKIEYIIYLIDANILIYAEKRNDKRQHTCQQVLKFNSPEIKIGTTDIIINEVKQNKKFKLPQGITIYKTGKLSEELTLLKTNYLKQPSEADLSLIQAAIEHPEIKGIITYDRDFSRIATQGLIQKKSTAKFWLGNAREFLKKYEIKTRVRPTHT